ncbi:MAG TPA: glycosyltransferase family A protein [Roseiflexaceae bacterium]|nr:glycosyltransferase family A protein [Roseiflexaceae bacterium]HMP39326.1 glycosyltransferase family A protein [Roseiflexaceae bacterium]
MPRVSVIIPCYNHARYLADAVVSVIGQTYRDWEIIIVDDGSTDASAAVAAQLIADQPQASIRLLRQANSGPAHSRNNGIRHSQGDYILPLDADDMLAPTLLARMVAALDADPSIGFVYCDVRRFGAESTTLRSSAFSLDRLRFDAMMMPETLFRREAWQSVGGFYEEREFAYEDWDFWLALAAAGWQGHHIAEPLVYYRRTAEGSRLTGGQQRDLELRAELFLRHHTLYPPAVTAWAQRVCSPTWRNRRHLRSAVHWLAAFCWYLLLLARYQPALLRRALVRPLFWRMPIRIQGIMRRFGG